MVTRGGRPVAEIRPALVKSGAALDAALGPRSRLDLAFEEDVADAVELLIEGGDPWVDA